MRPPDDHDREIRILDGTTFFVSDERGNVDGGGPYGLFHRDTRFVSRFRLEVNDRLPGVLSAREVDHFSAAFFLSNPAIDAAPPPALSIIRHRFIGDGVHEDVVVCSHHQAPVRLRLTFDVECDFADLFEVKAERVAKTGTYEFDADEPAGRFRYRCRRGDFVRETVIAFTTRPRLDDGRIVHDLTLAPQEAWRTCIVISLVEGATERRPRHTCGGFFPAEAEVEEALEAWHWSVPRLTSTSDVLNQTYRRSCADLAALRLRVGDADVLAAGLPWFMTVFGRDTLIASYQTLMFGRGLAASALRVLAGWQGGTRDDFRDEEPGKLPHEIRFGELTVFGDTPHSPYYGGVDATPLFLVLLHELYRWTADAAIVHEFKDTALRALAWIDEYGDRDGDGYVEYATRSPVGLRNKGWKDSDDAILFFDGRRAEPPIALCEVLAAAAQALPDVAVMLNSSRLLRRP